jgi:hypothetical protein
VYSKEGKMKTLIFTMLFISSLCQASQTASQAHKLSEVGLKRHNSDCVASVTKSVYEVLELSEHDGDFTMFYTLDSGCDSKSVAEGVRTYFISQGFLVTYDKPENGLLFDWKMK